MQAAKLPKPIMVTTPEALQRLAAALAREPIVAVDTESNSLYAYQEQVCLIQFSTPEADYLVDPLALKDLAPLGPIFASEEIEKVFHAAEYDVMTLKRDFGFEFRRLFDTMLAARILGWKHIGLGSVLEVEFGVTVNKKYQRANWGKRPLPEEMLAYARLDTHYLISLRDRLLEELRAAGRWDLAREDFRRLREVDGHQPADDTASCWRVSGAYDLSPQKAAVLKALCEFRAGVARSIDRPLFKVINDRSLLAVAERCPHNLHELERIPEMSPKLVQRYGKSLLEAVERGLRAAPLRPPRTRRPDEAYLERLDALLEWRKLTGRQLGVNSDVIMPRDLLTEVAAKNPMGKDELGEILAEIPYRLERFGGDILAVLRDALS